MTAAATSKTRYLLWATTLASFLTPFMGSSVNVALPAIGRDYALTALGVSWVASAFLLSSAITLVPLGRLADIYGRKMIFTAGAILLCVSSFGCLWAPGQTVFIALRAVQGIGGAMIFSTGTAMLVAAYPPSHRGRILGINIASVYIGLTIGPFIGGLLTQHLGWKTIFVFSALLAAGLAACALGIAQEERTALRRERFDLSGSLLYAVSLFALMYGFSRLPSGLAAALIAIGLVSFAFFLRAQWTKPFPVLNIHLFADNRTFAFSNLAALINYLATFAVTFLLSLYLQHVKGMTPSQTGVVLVVEPLLQALFSPLAGRLSDRYEPRMIASAGMALTVIGLAGLVFLDTSTSIPRILICLAILGVGFALFSSPNVNAIMSSVDSRFYGLASATLATMRLVGQSLSMGIAMLVFAVIIGDRGISSANSALLVTSARWIFGILAAACALGVLASLARGKVHKG